MKKTMRMIIAVCALLLFAAVGFAGADDSEYAKEGKYIGLLFVYNGMSGDFDDTMYYTSGSMIYDVPDVDNGVGFGLVFGHRVEYGAFELSYHRTRHDTSSSFGFIAEQTATYNVVDFNFKYDIFAQDRLKPYVLIGAGVPWLTVENSATDGTTVYEDLTFYGYELNLGVGMTYYLQPQWAVTTGVICRWNTFSGISDGALGEDLIERVVGLTVGVTYNF